MTAARVDYQLDAAAVLPFRAQLGPGVTEAVLSPDRQPSRFEVTYPETVQLAPGYALPTQLCTTVTMRFPMPFNGDEESFLSWLELNAASVVRDDVLPRLNRLLLAIEASAPNDFSTRTIRSVGELDLVFVTLSWRDKGVLARATPTILGPTDGAVALPDAVDLTQEVSVVRSRLIRAVDLIHHGYGAEAVLVAFAILDSQVQDYVATRLPHLSAQAGDALLGSIEKRRLSLYLGPLMRICVGESPLDDENVRERLRRVNALRNEAIHRAREVPTKEAQKALETIHLLLKFMDDRGANLDLPETLGFWTP